MASRRRGGRSSRRPTSRRCRVIPNRSRLSFRTPCNRWPRSATLSTAELDALSMLEGDDLERFRQQWRELSGAARARLIRRLHVAAEQRLRLDFSAINQLGAGRRGRERAAGERAVRDRGSQPRVAARAAEDRSRGSAGRGASGGGGGPGALHAAGRARRSGCGIDRRASQHACWRLSATKPRTRGCARRGCRRWATSAIR